MVTRRQSQKNSGNSRQDRDSEGRFTGDSRFPTGSVVAVATAAAAAAAGAFLWSRRAQIGEQAGKLGSRVSEQYGKLGERFSEGAASEADTSSGIDAASSAKAKRMRSSSGTKSQREISEEALSLKQSGDTPSDTEVPQSKVGAIAY